MKSNETRTTRTTRIIRAIRTAATRTKEGTKEFSRFLWLNKWMVLLGAAVILVVFGLALWGYTWGLSEVWEVLNLPPAPNLVIGILIVAAGATGLAAGVFLQRFLPIKEDVDE